MPEHDGRNSNYESAGLDGGNWQSMSYHDKWTYAWLKETARKKHIDHWLKWDHQIEDAGGKQALRDHWTDDSVSHENTVKNSEDPNKRMRQWVRDHVHLAKKTTPALPS